MTGAAQCSLTRAVTLHATHHFPHGGPAQAHGHLYRIEVTVAGTIGASQPTVIELTRLDEVLAREIVTPLAGSHLNESVAEFASGEQLPTCEGLAAWCWRRVAPTLPQGSTLERVRVAEDNTLWGDCTGVS
jgi:6-pyruvoyl-tetrahydropterin synthase